MVVAPCSRKQIMSNQFRKKVSVTPHSSKISEKGRESAGAGPTTNKVARDRP